MYLTTDQYYASMLGLQDERYKSLLEGVRAALLKEREGRVSVGASLYAFYHSIKKRRATSFYKFCEAVFQLDRTTVQKHIRVFEEFGNADKTAISDEYKEYSYSLLVELLTIPAGDRYKVGPTWTVKNVRELRRVLERSDAEEEEDEEAPPSDRYIRFKKWKRSDLCEKILSLEKENQELKKGILVNAKN